MVIAEDSVLCCIFPAYCVQLHNTPHYLKYSKLTLTVSVVVIVVVCTLVYFFDNRSHQFFKLSFFKKDSNVVSIASGSLLKMKRFLIDAACQTIEYHDKDRGTDVPKLNLRMGNGVSPAVPAAAAAADEFVRVIDCEETKKPYKSASQSRCAPKPPLPSIAKPLTSPVTMSVPIAATATQQ